MVWVDIGKLSWDDFIKYSKIDYSYTKNVRYCKSLHIIYYKVVEGREVQIKSLSGFLHWSIGWGVCKIPKSDVGFSPLEQKNIYFIISLQTTT